MISSIAHETGEFLIESVDVASKIESYVDGLFKIPNAFSDNHLKFSSFPFILPNNSPIAKL